MRESLLVLCAVAFGWTLNNLWRDERDRMAWESAQRALQARAEWEEFRKRQAQSPESEPAGAVGTA